MWISCVELCAVSYSDVVYSCYRLVHVLMGGTEASTTLPLKMDADAEQRLYLAALNRKNLYLATLNRKNLYLATLNRKNLYPATLNRMNLYPATMDMKNSGIHIG